MGMISEEALAKEADVQILGRTYNLRTENKDKLSRAAQWLNEKLNQLSAKHPLMKPQDIQAIFLLELSMELQDLREEGKCLLKDADELLEWLSEKSL